MQTRELREYIERRGWKLVPNGEYIDTGISGTKEKRPKLDRLMAEAHRRRFDCVVVWKFDRFARSVSHLLRALETLQGPRHRVRFLFRADGHEHAGQKDGIYRPGRRGRARALTYRRTREGRTAQRTRERAAARPTSRIRGRSQGCRAAKRWAFLGEDRGALGCWRRDRLSGRAGIHQEPF